jgi:hypothetical protein
MTTRLLIFLTVVGCWLPAASQVLNDGQVMTVTEGTALVVQGDFANNGDFASNGPVRIGGDLVNTKRLDINHWFLCQGNAVNRTQLNNNNTFILLGDWSNPGTYRPGAAEWFVLAGANQTVSHNGQTFNRLSVRGGGEKTFAQNATVAQQLILRQGLLTPTAGTDFLLAGEVVIDSASQDAYVNGRLLRQGTAERFYPIGRNGTYAPIILLAETAASGSADDVVVAAEAMAPVSAAVDTSLSRVSAVRVWQTQVVRGTSNTRVGISVLPDEEVVVPDSMVVAYAPNASTPFRSLGQAPVRIAASVSALGSFRTTGAGFFTLGVLSSPDKSGLVYIPNAFAPSSANAEERTFKLYGVNIASDGLELTVYNRWGNVVFSSRSYEQITRVGWDGRNQATQADEPPGVYTYALRGTLNTGRSIQRTGTVTLLR